MGIETLRDALPEFAKDIKLNLSSVLNQAELTPVQAWGTALACAVNSRNRTLIDAVREDCAAILSEVELQAAQVAASVMAMNNVYYRFGYLSGDAEFSSMPARLRMNSLRTHGAQSDDFELWCLAVSAVNGCGKCVESHWNQIKEHGISRDTALAAVRIASVMQAAAVAVVAA